MEEWSRIPDFPDYSVSNTGRVRNDDTGRILTLLRNQHGIVHVGLYRDSVQYKKAVAPLVAAAFLPAPSAGTFDTPINRDGDRSNNDVSNLLWRPRWFATKYFQQFHNGERGFDVPVVETKTEEWFPTSWPAAIRYGLLDREIMVATIGRTYVWPTYQVFRVDRQKGY